jgi:ABC-type multidrug transport system fused ATPase/permease subunit
MDIVKKIFEILTPSERNQCFLVLILILIVALIDTIGVASIFPFLALLSNPEIIETNQYINLAYQSSLVFGIKNQNQFIFFFGLLFFFFIILSLSLRFLSIYVQIRFTQTREYSLSKRLITVYLYQSYSWFLNQNSSELGKKILSEVSVVVNQSIVMILILFAQSSLAITLLVFLIIFDFSLALTIGLILTLTYVSILFLMKSLSYKIGSDRLQSNKERYFLINEMFNAIKEIKFRSLENFYINRFSKSANIYSKSQVLSKTIADFPRFVLEAVAFTGIIIFLLVLLKSGKSFTNIIPIIGLYTLAGYRLMPALQQIYHSISNLRFSKNSLDLLHKDISNFKLDKQKKNESILIFNNSIKLTNIFFSYPNSNQNTLKGLSLAIPSQSKVGIVGSTGCGKTTLIDIILGLLDPNEGSISIDKTIINDENKISWQKNIGYVPQQIYLVDDSILKNIAYGQHENNIDYKLVEKVAKIVNLHKFITDELLYGYNTVVGERGVRLSGGQIQRIGIARALYCDPRLLILDEATSSLDNLTERVIMDNIMNLQNKKTIIIVAHRLNTVKNCDIIFLLDQGKLIAQGKYDDLLKNKNFSKIANLK